jgi:hypothetical protein
MPPCRGVGFDATICCGWGGMDESRQQVVGSLLLGKVAMNFIHLGTLVSRMVLPTNLQGNLFFFFSFVPPPVLFWA